MAQTLEYENIGYNAPGGAVFGQTSTDKLGFYGTVPVARPVTASTNQVSTVSSTNVSNAGAAWITYGFLSQVEINNAITAVSTIQHTLKTLGLIAGGVQVAFTDSSRKFEFVDYGSSDGAQFGKASTDLISFYGATPVGRFTGSADVSTVTTVSASTINCVVTTWGFLTPTEIEMHCNAISSMQVALKQLGLMV
jgi:hypothetical protein